jgi:hypothetical protein
MSTFEWKEEWGDRDEWADTLSDKTELAGFKLGYSVICIEDYEENGMHNAYEGDEGVVIGIAKPREGGGPFNLSPVGERLLVAWEGSDPSTIDPAYVESI